MLGDDSDLLDVVLNNQDLFSLSHVPMYAFMVVVSIGSTKDKDLSHSNTVTEMYIHIFRHALRKHGKKTIRQLDPYLKRIKDHLFSLMKNAFNATIQKTLNLPDTNSDESDIFSVFLKNITIRESLTSAKTYCAFLHNTMQEFFSALWLLGNPGEIEKVLQLCQTEENKHMKYVLPFLSGLLGEHNIKLLKCLFPEDQMKKTSDWFIEKLLDTFLQSQSESDEVDVLFVCQCLFELQSPKACLMFLEKMDNQLDPQEDLDPHQCCALAYVISQSQDKEVYLNLEDCTISDFGINLILTCSPQFRLQLWIEPLKQITFLLEFFHKASQWRQQNDGIMTSQCCSTSVTPSCSNKLDLTDARLNLYSHVKDFETQTGRSFLPALQAVFQSAPDAPFSQRKNSALLDVLELHPEKKAVELTEDVSGWLPSCPATGRFVRSPLELIYIFSLFFLGFVFLLGFMFLVALLLKEMNVEMQLLCRFFSFVLLYVTGEAVPRVRNVRNDQLFLKT
ncbi:uncharacterized protein LOC127648184 [Xyrauchen texanus]|uniref:uncharacterized protein LOC127648184 n=1 Tax=Xyrauchen texanus TaxID=154827 RepID=UPI0022427B15|nr:uncharacterized protein LOC127648184 [Xyrauchen texanus]